MIGDTDSQDNQDLTAPNPCPPPADAGLDANGVPATPAAQGETPANDSAYMNTGLQAESDRQIFGAPGDPTPTDTAQEGAELPVNDVTGLADGDPENNVEVGEDNPAQTDTAPVTEDAMGNPPPTIAQAAAVAGNIAGAPPRVNNALPPGPDNPEIDPDQPAEVYRPAEVRGGADLFMNRRPSENGTRQIRTVKDAARGLLNAVRENGSGPEQTIAIRKVEEAVMWATKSIVLADSGAVETP